MNGMDLERDKILVNSTIFFSTYGSLWGHIARTKRVSEQSTLMKRFVTPCEDGPELGSIVTTPSAIFLVFTTAYSQNTLSA